MFSRIQNLVSTVCGFKPSSLVESERFIRTTAFKTKKKTFWSNILNLDKKYLFIPSLWIPLFGQIVCLNMYKNIEWITEPILDKNLFQSRTTTTFYIFPFFKSHWTCNIRHSVYIAALVLYSPLHEVDQLLFHLIFLGLFYVVLVFQHSLKADTCLPHVVFFPVQVSLTSPISVSLFMLKGSYYSFWRQNAVQCLCWLLCFLVLFTGSFFFPGTWVIYGQYPKNEIQVI